MTKNSFPVACLLVLALMTSFTAGAAARETDASGVVGREVSAPPWSAACTTDHGPSVCSEPMWVYGSPAWWRENVDTK
jgi:hypothetical protein